MVYLTQPMFEHFILPIRYRNKKGIATLVLSIEIELL